MAFLFRPKRRAFSDESLESFMLRVVDENFFPSYQRLALAIKGELYELDSEAFGALPTELNLLNVYHAKDNSLFRVRALELVERLLRLPKHELMKLALFRSDKRLMMSKPMLYRANVDLPYNFIRYSAQKDYSIPICPECLAKEPYIKQIWHLTPYNVCIEHKHRLIEQCPECGTHVNYIEHQSITHCQCGFELSKAKPIEYTHEDYLLSAALYNKELTPNNPLLSSSDLSTKLSAIAWYQYHQNEQDIQSNQVIQFYEQWPNNFLVELNEVKDNAEMRLIKEFNKTSFSDVFGPLILNAFYLSRNKAELHFITATVFNFLLDLIHDNPRTKKANIGDLLVSTAEAAAILSTSYEQVYRLHETGVLKLAFKLKLNEKLRSTQSAFYLREVIELKKSYGEFAKGMYLSRW